MADDIAKYAYGPILPACHCFEGDISPVGRQMIDLSVSAGEGLFRAFLQHGACPTAIPHLMAIVLSSLFADVANSRRRDDPLDEETGVSVVVGEICADLDRHAAIIPLEKARIQRMGAMEGTKGSC